MRVLLKSLAAGPGGCLAPGEHEVPAELGRSLVAGGYAVAVEVRKPEAPAEPVLFMTDDEISEGAMRPASPFQRVARKARVYSEITQPNHVETVVAPVDVDGDPHLVKFSRHHDTPQSSTVPGERDEPLPRAGAARASEPSLGITGPAEDRFA